MGSYFGSLATLLHAGGNGFLNAQLGNKLKRIAPKTWVYEFEWLKEAAALQGLDLERLDGTWSSMSLKTRSGRSVPTGFQATQSSQDLASGQSASDLGIF